jgi:hypothetical protein
MVRLLNRFFFLFLLFFLTFFEKASIHRGFTFLLQPGLAKKERLPGNVLNRTDKKLLTIIVKSFLFTSLILIEII